MQLGRRSHLEKDWCSPEMLISQSHANPKNHQGLNRKREVLKIGRDPPPTAGAQGRKGNRATPSYRHLPNSQAPPRRLPSGAITHARLPLSPYNHTPPLSLRSHAPPRWLPRWALSDGPTSGLTSRWRRTLRMFATLRTRTPFPMGSLGRSSACRLRFGSCGDTRGSSSAFGLPGSGHPGSASS